MATADGSRLMRTLLVTSLAANLFFCAWFGAQAWRRHRVAELAASPVAESILPQVLERLPPADRDVFRSAFSGRLPELRELQRQARAAMARVRAGMAARPFDLAAVRADMEAWRQARQRISTLFEEGLVEALPRMSDQGRLVLSQQRIVRR